MSIDKKDTAVKQQQELRLLGEQLAKGSDYLTNEVRSYVQFGNKLHYDNFWVEVDKTRSRDIAVERLKKLKVRPEELEFVEIAKRYSDDLIGTEKEAMEYMKKGSANAARTLVFGDYYITQKKLIKENIKKFQNLINKRALEDTRKAKSKAELLTNITVLLLTLSGILVLFFFYFIGIKQLVEPLKNLTNLMLKMAKGNLDLDIPVTSKNSINEIDEMGSTLDFFQRNLIKRYENERLLDIVANNTTSVIYFKDKEGRYLFTNESWNKLFCKRNEEVKGKTDFDLFPKEFADKFVKNDREVIKTGIIFNGEEIAPHNDVIRTYISSKVPLLDTQGKVYGLCGISTDITEIKNAEKRVEKERQKFFDMLDQLPVCFHLQASDHSIPFANKMFRERFGDTENNKCYQTIFKRDTPCDPCGTFRSFDSQKTESNIWNASDGKTYMSVVTPFDDIHGENLLMEMSIDISQEKRFEQSLAVSEKQFATIFEESRLGVALIDSLTGHIYEVNRKFADIVGRSLDEMATIDWMSITHPDDIQEDLDNMAALNSGKINGFNMEKRYIKPDGSHVWINMTISPLKVEDKSSPRHLCMIEDINEKKRIEKDLTRFGRLLNSSSNEIYMFDASTLKFTQVNSG
ncbi:MAG: PAS domain S-box protein, partial [Nitrospina sp.]|nr:PAS domain S-box protein [Nitrospina sp.]